MKMIWVSLARHLRVAWVLLAVLVAGCAPPGAAPTPQDISTETLHPTSEVGVETDVECYRGNPYRKQDLPGFLESVWPHPGCAMTLRVYDRSIQDDPYAIPMGRGIGAYIRWASIDTLTWDTVLPPVEMRTKLLVDGVEVSDETLSALQTLMGIWVYDENGNAKMTGYSPGG